jgi:MerR family redox-sensitive transcriptional activator SoxR
MPLLPDRITIGELATRSGMARSALRFYEDQGLIAAERTAGNQRVYPRPTLRRVAFIRAAQAVGLTLEEIAAALATLPADRTPVKRYWERLSTAWRDRLDQRIVELERLRDGLTSCIGCGCLSLRTCRLLNPDDGVSTKGSGARYLLGDEATPGRIAP